MEVFIRQATDAPELIGKIMEVLQRYHEESPYSQTGEICTEGSIAYLVYMARDHHLLYAETENGEIVGVCIADGGKSFWKQGELTIGTFYVVPEYRGTRLGRMFLQAIKQLVIKYDYMSAGGCSTSGFGGKVEKQFENMMVKEGFVPTGRACIYYNPKKGTEE